MRTFVGMGKCKYHINIKTEGLEETKRSLEVQLRSNRNNLYHHREYLQVHNLLYKYYSMNGILIGTDKYERVLSEQLLIRFQHLFEANHLNHTLIGF